MGLESGKTSFASTHRGTASPTIAGGQRSTDKANPSAIKSPATKVNASDLPIGGTGGGKEGGGGDPTKSRRIELILRQIDSLPTLPTVATKLLALTVDDQSHASEIIELIRSDPALTSKILSICRRADMGIRDEAKTIDKAVVLLGFNAVRNAVLSIKVFEFFHNKPAASASNDSSGVELDRVAFWRHSLATAIAAELLAIKLRSGELNHGEAFVCGLIHDVGKLALDYVLPKSYGRVVELVDLNQGNIADYERRIIGIDHHTAGKRLAEQWQMPHVIQDCIWLHGVPYHALPRLEHNRMIALVSLADIVARRSHLGYSGNFTIPQEEDLLVRVLGLSPADVDDVISRLHDELEKRCRVLGLDDVPSHELYVQSIQQANQMLGRLNTALERRSHAAMRQSQVLEAISSFHNAALPGRSLEEVLTSVVQSATAFLGDGYYATITQGGLDAMQWLICQYGPQGQMLQSQLIEPPSACPELCRLDANQPSSLNLMGIMPWISDYLANAPDLREVRFLPLGCGWGTAALLLHDRATLPPWNYLQSLTLTWGASLAAAGQHDGARRLGEELAEANRALAQTQDRLLQSESMARLGEMAAGAAHEMNNPLTVISGRAQLLAQLLPESSKEKQAAQTIAEQAHRVSDLISAMRMYAQPPKAIRSMTALGRLLEQSVHLAEEQYLQTADNDFLPPVQITANVPEVPLDAEQVGQAVSELVLNALQANPRSQVTVNAKLDGTGKGVCIEVVDDGCGMDRHTLAHAMDPFFSNKTAGRRTGLGLSKSQLWAAAHGGRIDLRSQPGQGTTVLMVLPLETTG